MCPLDSVWAHQDRISTLQQIRIEVKFDVDVDLRVGLESSWVVGVGLALGWRWAIGVGLVLHGGRVSVSVL